MVAEADGEGLVAGFKNLVEKGFDVFLMFFDEFLLTAAGVDDEADAEGELVVMGEEANLLRDAVFDDGEVVLGEAGYDAAVWVADAEGGVDEVGLHRDDGNALRVGEECQQKQRR